MLKVLEKISRLKSDVRWRKNKYIVDTVMKSQLIVKPLVDKSIKLKDTTENFKFSAVVAQFGLLLRDSEFKGHSSYENILSLAQKGKGEDKHGYRAEFIKLVETCKLLEDTKK